MFEVLCDLARRAERGMLSAITAVDGSLQAVRIVDGEERAAVVQVTESTTEQETRGVDWRDNRYIKS
jgi:vacuolar-type H+-ATPase subunit B/Vma2